MSENNQRSSVGDESADSSMTSKPAYPFSSSAQRDDMVQGYLQQGVGAMHNPRELPRINGEWQWLEEADRMFAQDLGYDTPIDVTLARARGTIRSGVGTPIVIFLPSRTNLNPFRQPRGAGRWEYVTVGEGSARELAWTQLGSQAAYGFEDVRYPTAHQVWTLRQQMTAEGRDTGVFDGIDIAWLVVGPPTGPPPPDTTSNPDASQPSAKNDEVAPNLPPPHTTSNPKSSPSLSQSGEVDPDLIDPDTYLRHDLTNGGEHDQTGADDLHWYRTIQIKGKQVTCDVSQAILKRCQPHKFWIVTKKGVWKQYEHHATVNWNDRDSVTKLNAWRDQNLSRGGWPPKRKVPRGNYTQAEMRWLFDIVDRNGGKPPGSHAIEKIAREFNKLFKTKRSDLGIGGQCSRLSKNYVKNGGKLVFGPRRGEAKRKRKERASNEEETPQKRKRTLPPKGAEKEKGSKRSGSEDENMPDAEGLTSPGDGGEEVDADGDADPQEEGDTPGRKGGANQKQG